MKHDTIISLNNLEIDVLIHTLDEVISSSQKVPEVITEAVRQELFAELDITLFLSKLKEKLGKEKIEQVNNQKDLDGDKDKLYLITLSDNELDYLRNGDYSEVEIVVEQILEQINT